MQDIELMQDLHSVFSNTEISQNRALTQGSLYLDGSVSFLLRTEFEFRQGLKSTIQLQRFKSHNSSLFLAEK